MNPRAFHVVCRACIPCMLLVLGACMQTPTRPPKVEPVKPPTTSWSEPGAPRCPMPVIQPDGVLNLVVVDLLINGRHERFLVDTGSQITMFSRELCDRLSHRKLGAKALIEGLDGIVEVDILCVDSVNLGFVTLSNLTAEVIPPGFLDSSNRLLRARGEKELSGVLGNDLLKVLGATLDFQSETIQFHKP